MLNSAQILQKKRDGLENSGAEIRWLVAGAVSGQVPDYQVAAWLMAAFIRGLSDQETMALTQAFVELGQRLYFEEDDPPRVDKHSTGGVGDKTSLVIAPLVASAGLLVPMVSGRGLGFTGGTLDKMESIPGYRTSLSLAELRSQVRSIGLGLVGSTRELAPGDQIFYKLRDVTATVESTPLIVASILSKKAAEDLSALVLDVKFGHGAVMKSIPEAENLARALVGTGRLLGMEVVALLTDMSQPLGNSVGNALEVMEAIETLQGGGPQDFRQVCLELSGWMLSMAGQVADIWQGVERARELLQSGRPLELFAKMVEAQGGNASVVEAPEHLLGNPQQRILRASADGFLASVRADTLGRAALRLGAGRERASDSIDHQAGILVHRKVGQLVKRGDPLATLYYNQQSILENAFPLASQAFEITVDPVEEPELIRMVVK